MSCLGVSFLEAFGGFFLKCFFFEAGSRKLGSLLKTKSEKS